MNAQIDFTVLNSFVTDRAGQIEILKSFRSENRSDIAYLSTALSDGNADTVVKTAHRLKGVCGMLGAIEMKDICLQIEHAARQNELQLAQETMQLLEQAMVRVESSIDGFMNAGWSATADAGNFKNDVDLRVRS
jgi:HPt (histidine-containing phosphotransfer) domain-containing protein